MAFTAGSRGIYSPIRVFFETIVYEQPLQHSWHLGSYKCYIALIAELLRLQQVNQLSPHVSVEDMIELLMEESKKTLRIQFSERLIFTGELL